MKTNLAILAAAAALLAGCATTPGARPTDVTRYHLGAPLPAGSVAVEPAANGPPSLESQGYADAVAAELARLGFAPGAGAASQYIAAVSFVRTSRGQVRTPPKFSIGLGGGSFGGGVGLGGGVSTGIGSKTLDVYGVELMVQLRRRADGTVVWEGRAISEQLSGRPDAQPGATAQKLARALFTGFPGESGITITVP